MKVTATTLPRRSLRASRALLRRQVERRCRSDLREVSALAHGLAERERQPAHHRQCYETPSRPSVPHVHATPSHAGGFFPTPHDKPIRRAVHDDMVTADLQEAKMWLALLDAEQGDSVAEH